MSSELDALKTLLLHEWDPLGLAGCDGAQNHYDPYAIDVFDMLRDGKDESAIAIFLKSVVASQLGLADDAELDQAIAARAVAIGKPF
jgi:hypothetical protein